MSVLGGSNGRKVQERKTRVDGWTKARRILFLDTFAATCNTALAVRKCGMNESGLRALRRRDPHFAVLYEEALQEGYRRLEAELLARALGQQIGDENPAAEELGQTEPPPFDPVMALKVLQLRNAALSGSICDAIVTPEPGRITFPILTRLAGAGIAVSDEEALRAMALAFKRLKIIVEPGGAVALAAALFHGDAIDRNTVIAVTSGGNVDTDLFALALQRFG